MVHTQQDHKNPEVREVDIPQQHGTVLPVSFAIFSALLVMIHIFGRGEYCSFRAAE